MFNSLNKKSRVINDYKTLVLVMHMTESVPNSINILTFSCLTLCKLKQK